jgi:hypothetical protein
MVQLFASYPVDLVNLALHPVNGLPGKCEFIPSIATAKRFLDEQQEKQRADAYRERVSRKQIAHEAPVDPEMRARVGALFEELCRGMRSSGEQVSS